MKKQDAFINHYKSYADAFEQSTKATGAVRCSYASIFNQKGMPLFCFQAANFSGAIVEAEYTPATDRYSIIPATLTDEAVDVLETYWNGIVRKDYLRDNALRLSHRFDESGHLIDRTVYVNPHDLAWTPVSTSSTKAALALAVAAAAALLN